MQLIPQKVLRTSEWHHQPIQTRVVYFVNYASVFNDTISIEELKLRMSDVSEMDIADCISDLSKEGLMVSDGQNVCVPGLKDKLSKKADDLHLSGKLIRSRRAGLKILGWLPFISFVGICGSIAAGNPAETKERELDLDVFVISKNQWYWLTYILLSFYRDFIGRWTKNPLCFNYIMDTSDLVVKHQNLYTATEIINLVPISGRKGLNQFLNANRWVNDYFPSTIPQKNTSEYKVWTRISLHHKVFFALFNLVRCFKNMSLKPILTLSFNPNSTNDITINFNGTRDGGYLLMIVQKFEINLKRYFPGYYDEGLFKALFSDEVSGSLISNKYDLHKVVKKVSDIPGWKVGFKKYETQS